MPQEQTPARNDGAADSKAVDQAIVDQIDVEFEKYIAMRAAVRKKSGTWRRSSLTDPSRTQNVN